MVSKPDSGKPYQTVRSHTGQREAILNSEKAYRYRTVAICVGPGRVKHYRTTSHDAGQYHDILDTDKPSWCQIWQTTRNGLVADML